MAAVDRNKPRRAKTSESTYTIMDFAQEFPDDATCLDYLWRQHHTPDGERANCPKCGTIRKFHRVASRPSYSCDTCGHHIHPTAGTIFHKSSTSLHLWFHAIFLMSSTRCGISAKQLERELGVTYKTAWRMFDRIRKQLMQQDDEPLSGEVEADDMYVGGKPRQSDRAKWDAKTPSRRAVAAQKWSAERKTQVFGAVERGGRVRASVVPKGTVGESARLLTVYVDEESTLYTDEYVGFNKPGEGFAAHKRIKHAERVYVDGDVHTQTIEGFWSLVKRGISGTHHAVSAKHLQGYLNEYAWRYNHRDDEAPTFLTLLESI